MQIKKLKILVVVLLLIFSACGGSEETSVEVNDTSTTSTSSTTTTLAEPIIGEVVNEASLVVPPIRALFGDLKGGDH